MSSPQALVAVAIGVAYLSGSGCSAASEDPRPISAEAVDAETAAFADLEILHRDALHPHTIPDTERSRAERRLLALEDDASTVDAVDRAALRFLARLHALDPQEVERVDDAAEFLFDRGFDASDRAVAYRPELALDARSAALAYLANPERVVNRGRPACIGVLPNRDPEPALLARVAGLVPGVVPVSRCPRSDRQETMTFHIHRPRWVGAHSVKMMTVGRFPGAHLAPGYGEVLELTEHDGVFRVVRASGTWVS